jgi:hypothetical protein
LMMVELEDLHMIHLRALENIEKNKMWFAKYYNKKVKVKQFAEGDLVWKALLPMRLSTVHSTSGVRIGKVFFGWLGARRKCIYFENFARRIIHCCYKWEILEEILS